MDKSLAGLIGAVGALAAVAPAHAAENMGAALHEAMQVTSYADLLKPNSECGGTSRRVRRVTG